MSATLPAQRDLERRVYGRILFAVPFLAAILFVPAGTLAYWEAWLYLAVLLIPMFFVFRYLLQHSPQLLERRIEMRERDPAQRRIIGFSLLYFVLAFAIPGLDHRWGWSDVPVVVVFVANAVVLLGYGLITLVFRENQYAARTIRVEEGQTVITTGPYRYVRHPMYLGAVVMYLASPLALGSYWALLPAIAIVPILVARIINEERVLERDLPDYRDYQATTRYRLVPGLW